jgi:cbb3-type cytochrome oxidase subunit 3
VHDYFWLVFLPLLLLLVVLYVFRPGSRKRYDKASRIPFEDEKKGQKPPRDPEDRNVP